MGEESVAFYAFQSLSPFAILFLVWVILGIVSAAFYIVGRRNSSKNTVESSDSVTAHTMALLALIVSFSFSMAVSRYDERKDLAVYEANAVSTAYLQSKLIKFKNPDKVKKLYTDYVDLRIDAYSKGLPSEFATRLSEIEDGIWAELVDATNEKDGVRGAIEGNYAKSVNTMFDTANERKYILFKLLPVPFYILILVLASAALASLNFDRGLKKDHEHWKSVLLIFLFGIIYMFIFDLDHSRKGLIKVDQNALIEFRSKM